jgi:Bacterial extracellular solute-binding proteins, family 3
MNTKVLMALGAMSLGLMATLSSAQSMTKMGDCDLMPTMAKDMMKFTPAVAGQLTVEVNLPAPLWYNGDTPDTIKSGAEYCMAANLAHRAGLSKIVIKNVAWDGLVAGQTKNFDLALSQISITPERKKVVEFSTPYFYSDIGVMVKKGMKVDGTSIKKLRLGVQQGTTGETFARDTIKAATLKVFPDTPGMFTASSRSSGSTRPARPTVPCSRRRARTTRCWTPSWRAWSRTERSPRFKRSTCSMSGAATPRRSPTSSPELDLEPEKGDAFFASPFFWRSIASDAAFIPGSSR